ncbi:hypothetical protein MHH52_28550 [Paenibacillus sp. FSL K6-0276]|uniref:hypothetical protein n=1 Tax=Paenibacillus sp. FSL K6-0276 TaxID=2921450 RepID=UPI0030EC388B
MEGILLQKKGTHYKTKEKDTLEPFISLRELSKQVYPHHNEDYAYTKTLSNFKAACKQNNLDHKDFLSGRQYNIPQTAKTTWVSLITSIDLIEKKAEPKIEEIDEYFMKLLQTRKSIENLADTPPEFSLEDNATFLDFFYAPDGKQNTISDYYQKYIVDHVAADFDYIQKNAPEDRVVFYSETYHDQAMFHLQKIRNIVRAMTNGKLNQ